MQRLVERSVKNKIKIFDKRDQQGVSLIESLVAVVVAALGILGILGVQMRTLTDTSTTVRRAQAIRLIDDLGERMKTNPNALANINSYTSGFNSTPTLTSCASGCDLNQLATYDLANWKNTVSTTLPIGKASIFIPPAETVSAAAGQGRQLGIMIAWRENERADADSTYKNNIDNTKINNGGTFADLAGGAATCPAGFTCHLQYLTVSGRCAPYTPGGNTPTYYCPGG